MAEERSKPNGQASSVSDPFSALTPLDLSAGSVLIYRLSRLSELGIGKIDRLPYSIKILLENALRNCDGYLVTEDDVKAIANWSPKNDNPPAIPFMPARVLLQDLTGVPAVADLAAMRSAVSRLGHDPKRINPIVPVDLVIDHSVQTDFFGSGYSFAGNVEREFERNGERFSFLRWAQGAFQNFRVVPPGTGIVHQVNLEYLASVIQTQSREGKLYAYPDTLVGTDSHTTMINGLSVLGWGVGGIEAEAVMLNQPLSILLPEVVGFRVTGVLGEGVTATDLVLTITQILRKKGVVGKFVEYFGPGLSKLALADRATIGNMAPEYGATCGFFPIDEETLRYLRQTSRDEHLVELVEVYARSQGLFRTDESAEPDFTDTVELDLSTVVPSLAGPRRPQDRVPVSALKETFASTLPTFRQMTTSATAQGAAVLNPATAQSTTGAATAVAEKPTADRPKLDNLDFNGQHSQLKDGAVAIASITSCTNTSNPSVMLAAGLLAREAVKRGLSSKPWVKTSLAPGSPVVLDYLTKSGLLPYLEALGFHIVGFGCMTCIGNSGPLPEQVSKTIRDNDLVVASVLSGNRNFEGRINPDIKMNFLASPPLVVAYALAGTVDIDLVNEPLGNDPNGQPVFLRDIWPSTEAVHEAVGSAISPDDFKLRYSRVFEGDERWKLLPVPEGDLYAWDEKSTYIQEPPFFTNLTGDPIPPADIVDARVLVIVGDMTTTDHISPAGSIPAKSPAGRYLQENGVSVVDFNSYGARRGNHQVMMRGTFANIRLRNQIAPGTEGGVTNHLPDGELMTIFDASRRYGEEGVPLIVIAGQEYGAGSSRDWAAKGPLLLGVRGAIAQSFERIHRSNLVGMGVLPMQFLKGESLATYGLTGRERYSIAGIAEGMRPRQELSVRATKDDGTIVSFPVIARLDSPVELDYFKNGGILQTVLRKLLAEDDAQA